MNEVEKSNRVDAVVSFPPVPNGVDYLVSVVELLARDDHGEPNPRDLKYAVLHLQAAVEVLLKARLQIEHWSLVVKDATKTSKQSYLSGDFESLTQVETIRKLSAVLGIDIAERDKQTLLSLAKTRNALQHWGLAESAPAVEARAADVLDFLIRFVDQHLLDSLDADARQEIDEDMRRVRDRLTGIRAYVRSRMERLRAELSESSARTVECPHCGQLALVVDGIRNECHFCPRVWLDFDMLASRYASDVLYFSLRDIADGGEDPRMECPDCDSETLVLGVRTAACPEGGVNICFSCAHIFDVLEYCARCGRVFGAVGGETVCGSCWNEILSKD